VRARIKQSQIRLNVEKEIRETYWAYVNTLRLLTSTREREQVFENAFKEAVVLKERDAMSEIEFTAAEIRYRESRQRIRTLELDALFARASLVRAVGIRALGDVTPLEAPAEPGQPAQKEIQ